jgi:glycosyl transferase family 25
VTSPLLDYFGNIQIIHLRHRTDRFAQLRKELKMIGVSIDDTHVGIPVAPIVSESYGFPSNQVYGNFLSHLDILKQARDQNRSGVLVLEDDAIFRVSLRNPSVQKELAETLEQKEWDMVFLGHPIDQDLAGNKRGLIETKKEFKWAHCYAVSAKGLPPLIDYLEATMERPRGHPDGGKMYIDGAFSLYRRLSKESITLIHYPALSIQRGSPSGIADGKWYDSITLLKSVLSVSRRLRDLIWRYTGWLGAK